MKNFRTATVGGLLLLLAAGGYAASKDRELIEIQVPGYRIITGVSKDKALQYLQQLERFRQTLEVSLNRTSKPSAIETRLYILTTEDWKQFFQPRENVAGFFSHDRFVNYLVIDGGADRKQTLETIFHEYAHFVLDSQFTGFNHPAWLHEGFAQFLQGATFGKSQATLALPVELIFQLRDSQWIPIERVLAVDMRSPEYNEKDMAPTFYGECWALVHYAVSGEPALWGRLRKYLLAVDEGQPLDTAFSKHVQMEPGALDKVLQEYVNRKSLQTLVIDLPPQTAVQVQSLRTVDARESAVMLAEAAARLSLQWQDGKAGRVRPLLLSIAQDSPLYPRAVALQGLIAAASDEKEQANESIAQLAKLTQTPDIATAKIAGTLLLSRVLNRKTEGWPSDEELDDLKRARDFYSAAFIADPKDLEAIWGFSMASVWSDIETAKAVELLKAAYAGEPGSDYLAFATAVGYERLHQPQTAERYWRDTIKLAREPYLRKMAEAALSVQGDDLAALGIAGPLAKKYTADVRMFNRRESEQGAQFKVCAAKSDPSIGSVLDGKQVEEVLAEISKEPNRLVKIHYVGSMFSEVVRTYFQAFSERHPSCEFEYLSAMAIQARISQEVMRLIPPEVQQSNSSQFKAQAAAQLKFVARTADDMANILQAQVSHKVLSPPGAKRAAEIVAGVREALEPAKKIIDTYPVTPDDQLLAATQKNDPHQYELAKAAYLDAVKKNPRDGRSWLSLAEVYMRTHDYPNAADAFTKVIEINPKYWPAWSNRALVRGELGQRAEALKDAQIACDNNDKFACGLLKELAGSH